MQLSGYVEGFWVVSRILRGIYLLVRMLRDGIQILFVTIPPFVSEQWVLKRFWKKFIEEEFNVVVSSKDTEEENELDQLSYDWIAWMVILKNLARHFTDGSEENFTIFHADRFERRAEKKKNVLTIGGPKSNDFTEEILNRSGKYKFGMQLEDYDGDRAIVRKDRSKVFEPNLDSGSDVRYDYGLITYCRNPYSENENEIIAISGSHGLGTKAASELLMDKETLNKLKEIGHDYFQAVCIVEVDGDSASLDKHIVDFHPDIDVREKSIVPLGEQ